MTGERDRHDRLFKETFSNVEHLAVQLRAVLPPSLAQAIDYSTLKLVRADFEVPGLMPLHGDLLVEMEIYGKQAMILVLVEHQSTVDSLMPLRCLGYQYGYWIDHAKKQQAGGKSVLPLPVIIPVVVHHGKAGWTGPRRFEALFDAELLSHPELRRYVPDFELVLDDLSQLETGEIVRRAQRQAEQAAALVLLALRYGRSLEKFLEELFLSRGFVVSATGTPSGVDAFRSILRYFEREGGVGFREALEQAMRASHANLEAKEAVMNIAEELKAEGRAEAKKEVMNIAEELKAEGRAEAKKEVMNIAEELKAEGRAEAKEAVMNIAEELKAEGRVEGRVEAARKLLGKQLRLKFHGLQESSLAPLESATETELERWAERVLTALSVEEVFR